jgi:hypothetical protein
MTMEGHTFISWNIPNFVTVVLMGAVGIVLLKLGMSLWKKQQGQS